MTENGDISTDGAGAQPSSPAFVPDNQFTPDQQVASTGSQGGVAPAFVPDTQFQSDEDRFGTIPQQALTVGENLVKGYGSSTLGNLAEKGLSALGVPGVTPEEQAGREAANPWEAGVSQAAGLGLGILTGTGEAQGLELAGQGALRAAGVVSKPATLLGKIGAGALKSAVETALYQTDNEVAKKINDPTSAVAPALAHIGLAGLLGGAGGAFLGPFMPVWAKANGEAVEQGINDFKNTLDGTVTDKTSELPAQQIEDAGFGSMLTKQKVNAPELEDMASRNNWPIAEGITSASPQIQKAEDALLNGPPTLASLGRQKLYNDIYNQVGTSVDRATVDLSAPLSETQAGDALKASLTDKLEAENAPIKQLYSSLEDNLQGIPVSDPAMAPVIRSLNDELGNLVPGTGRYNYMKAMIDRLPWVDDLSKLKSFRTEAGKAAGIESRDLAGKIADSLNGVEERAIRRFADKQADPTVLNGLLDQVSNAKGQYRQFITKLQTLGKSMGKSKVYGPQDFIDFVDGMNPQTLARKLFNENNVKFSQYFSQNFPEEFQIMRGYQRNLIREGAMKDGIFDPKRAIKAVTNLDPEMQKLLYSDPDLQVIKDANEYLGNMPKSFNPSGTAHESAFRAFFEHPTGAVISNLRDYGIQSFIKAFGRAAPGAEGQADKLLPLLGKAAGDKEVNAGAFKNAVDYTMSAIKGENLMGRAAKSVFSAAPFVAAGKIPDQEDIKKFDKKLQDVKAKQGEYASVGGDIGHYLPNHDIALKSMVFNASNYVNNARPLPIKPSPLDKEIDPSPAQMSSFNRLLTIAAQPLSALNYLKSGQLTLADVNNLKAMYPAFHAQISQKLMDEMTSEVSKKNPIPYKIKQGLSTFLGQPLELTQGVPGMQAITMANAPHGGMNPQTGQPKKTSQSTASAMQKASKLYQTPEQARTADRASVEA